jgi:hypothetical protein
LTISSSGAETSPITLDAGILYFLVASGTGIIAGDGRQFDAEYIQRGSPPTWQDSKPDIDYGIGLSTGTPTAKGLTWTPAAFQSDHVYGVAIAGGSSGQTISLKYFDDYYLDNAGSLSVKVYEQVVLEQFSAWSTPSPSNSVENSSTDPLFVEFKDGAASASVSLSASLLSGQQAAADGMIAWKVTGGAVVGPASGAFGADEGPSMNLADAGATYTVTVWVDGNDNNIVDSEEQFLTLDVQTVRLDRLEVKETFAGEELAVTTADDTPEFYIKEDASTNRVTVFIDARGTPETAEAGEKVLWSVAGPAGGIVGGVTAGTFADDVEIQLSPPKAARVYKVKIGFDDNANGTLDEAEVSRSMDVIPVLVETTVSKTTMTLMQTNDITSNVYAGGSKTPTVYDFQVRFAGQNNNASWVTYRSQAAATTTEVARVAGRFETRTKIVLDEKNFESPPHTNQGAAAVEVRFPDWATIASAVTAAMNDAWASTIAATTPTMRREEGFWITLDTSTGIYSPAGFTIGTPVDNTTTATLDGFLRKKPTDSVKSPTAADSPTYLVGWFHTHTPMTYRTGRRDVGASPGDVAFETRDDVGVPGAAYDYVEDAPASNSIPGGHPLDAAAKVYSVGGVVRRATP